MTSITKPPVRHRALPTNALGLTRRDYEGAMSTLCAGCGHDSVTAALIQACFELDVAPHMLAKLSGIGCSAKTTAYFARQAHGLNGVHGRMPSLASGAHAANRALLCLGVSGDGDSLSIGLGQLCHAIRRNVRMLYVLENNGVYGLTKGQFSASADVGSTSKRGAANIQQPIDPVLLALTLGATFVARSFSGDKAQLVPILKAGLLHDGFAIVDVISPCVSFNDHDGSTKSYRFTREHAIDVAPIDLVPMRREQRAPEESAAAANGDGAAAAAAAAAGAATVVTMPDGSVVRFRAVDERHDPTDRDAAYAHVRALRERGEVATGLLYVNPGSSPSMHEANGTVAEPLARLPYESLCPGSGEMARFMDELR